LAIIASKEVVCGEVGWLIEVCNERFQLVVETFLLRGQIFGGENDEDLAFRSSEQIFQIKLAAAFFGASLPKSQKTAKLAIGFAISWKTKTTRSILKVQSTSDDQGQADCERRTMGPHHASKRVPIRDADAGKTKCRCCLHQLFGMRCPAQEAEIGRDL